MTSVCAANGPSQIKAGLAQLVYMTPFALGAMLNNIPMLWAVPLAAYLGAKQYDLNQFCPGEPPADPGFGALDAVAMLNVYNPVVSGPAQAKFQQLVDRWAWYQMCECASGAQPAPPPALPPPANLPQINPPAIKPPLNAPCFVWDDAGITLNSNQGFNRGGPDFTGMFATGLKMQLTETVVVAPGPNITVTLSFSHLVSNILTTINTFAYTFPYPYLSYPFTLGIPPGTEQIIVNVQAGGGAGQTNIKTHIDVFCNTIPGASVAPCCPPDPILAGQVDQILRLVTLIQRQAAPFAYVYGANHPNLTGTGSIPVSGLIGVSLQVTAIPLGAGLVAGNPNARFDLGYVTMMTADGAERSRKIDHDGVLMIPPEAGVYTSIGYTLPPGVVVAIRELVREP